MAMNKLRVAMQERLIDIIVYLLDEIQHEEPMNNYVDLSKTLISKGYTENEINMALSWIFNHLQNKSSSLEGDLKFAEGSVRVLHDLERMILAADAYGYLLQLRHLNLLTDFDVEVVIEKALSLGTTSITLEDIKSIAASIIFGFDTNNYSWDGFFYYPGSNTVH